MSKIVFDSDGLIKIVKTDIFDKIKAECIISEEVYYECVIEGKKRLYEDAYKIEDLINNKKIKIEKVEKIKDINRLGKGEISTLQLFYKIKGNAIISDDRRFLMMLEELDIPFITPAEVIVRLFMIKVLNKKESLEALNKIREIIRKENYDIAIKTIGGKNGN